MKYNAEYKLGTYLIFNKNNKKIKRNFLFISRKMMINEEYFSLENKFYN